MQRLYRKPPASRADRNAPEQVQLVEDFAGAEHHAGEGVFGDHHRQTGFFPEQDIQVTQQCPSARQDNPLVDDVGGQLGRGPFQTDPDRLDDGVDRFGKGLPYLVGINFLGLGDAGDQVAPLDLHGAVFSALKRLADLDLDDLGHPVTDQQVVLPLDELDDRLIHLVAADPYRFGVDDPRQRDDRHFGGAAANIDDHVAGGLGDGKTSADRRGHRLLDQVNLTCSGRFRRLLDRTLLHLGDPGRHADHDPRPDQGLAVMDLVDEVAEHLLGDVEIGDHAILHRPDGGNIAGGAAEHFLGLHPDGKDLMLAVVHFMDRHHGRLADHDPLPLQVDQGIGCPKVNGEVVGKHTKQVIEYLNHGGSFYGALLELGSRKR